MIKNNESHSIVIGYILWILGFMGAHRFYYGRTLSGIVWFFTLGLFFIGWLVDLFLIPDMNKSADRRFTSGPINYNLAWVLLTFLGVLGVHRFYQRKWISGLLYFFTVGFFGIGIIYDWCTLNDQIDELHRDGRLV